MGRNRTQFNSDSREKFPRQLHGLQGVMDLFHVSKATASRYVNGVLKPSVTRQGNILFIDTKMALKCFGVQNPSDFVK